MEEKESIVPTIIAIAVLLVVVFAVTFLVFFIFARQRQNRLVLKQRALQKEFEQQLMQAQVEVQEQTMEDLGRELHDNVGQLISTAKMLLGMTERNLPDPPETLTVAQDTLGKALQSIRSLSKSLNKEWLKQFNVIENLHSEVERINATNDLRASMESAIMQCTLLPEQQVMLFRIIQEAIQNSIKHAKAKNIVVRIAEENKKLEAEISDDGVGFDMEKQSAGVGLMNIKHRVQLLKGNVTWQSKMNEGTCIKIVLPV
ncbi:MAG: sensor histidine kinase [Chitinophagaceae bacterium]|jgi:signal transduction histidine kinase|nr:sensor histidine kinase [Chitinophagaceae bacterium]